ncbi:capsular polysaccharide synthesis protein [Rubrivirga litoralis]|uniref:Capsular polysaccharide synthesis protein n=1 Tax=Rubrivirga litoralis TaxID=3075598 RepID=A0ABU3BPJ1_9BACT|nr:capsular polysaccharide synthesis protein [Rubrivirga sp. F394]MDT0631202.1 capsular polysaccharide synthesis protein [Rubrivirga sp. F394]
MAAETPLGPRRSLWNRVRHRRFVPRQMERDKAVRARLGLDTFVADWDALVARPDPGPVVPRRLWTMWDQGEAAAPPLVRAALDSWREVNPGWDVTVLDADTVGDWIEMPRLPRHVTRTAKSEVVRLRLLSRYGGAWADATAICLRPLDDWVDRAAASGRFAFARPQPARHLASWFLASQPADPVFEAWRRWCEPYITAPLKPAAYLWMHYTFEWLLREDPRAAAAWAGVPRLSARGPHVLQRALDGHLDASDLPTPAEAARLPMVKMSFKKGYTPGGVADVLAGWGLTAPPTVIDRAGETASNGGGAAAAAG